MFNLFRRNCLYNESIDPHCAYCAHCKPDNEYQGVCEFRGIVAMAGSCRKFEYDALRRKPPKPARIRGRFTDEDFFFQEHAEEEKNLPSAPLVDSSAAAQKPLICDDLSAFSDLWEDDDESTHTDTKEENSEPAEPVEPEPTNEQEEDSEE